MSQIDARALAYGGFVLVHPGLAAAWIPTDQVYSADLSAGSYGVELMSGVGPLFNVTVDDRGRFGYDQSLSFLSGQGTQTLTITGLSMSIDATPLWGGPLQFKNVDNPRTITSGPLRLIPGPHQFVYGSAQVVDFTVTVTGSGTFDYPAPLDVRSDGCLSGRGTADLTLEGYPLSIDARDSGATALALADLTGDLPRLFGQVRLLPFSDYRFILQSAVVTDPSIVLTLADDGTVSLSPALAAIAWLDRSATVPVLLFTALPDGQTTAWQPSAAIAIPTPNRAITVLARDSGGTIHYAEQYDPFFNSYWAVFRPFGGRADALAACQLIDSYADYATTMSQTTVVWRLDSGRLSYRTIDASGYWTTWLDEPSPSAAGRLRDLAVAALPLAAQQLVVLDDAGELFTRAIPPNGPAAPWTPLPSPPSRAPVSAVAATCDNEGRPILVAAGDTVYLTTPQSGAPGAGWQPWVALPATPAATAVTASSTPSGAPLLVITTASGEVMEAHRERLGWSPWSRLAQFSDAAVGATAARCGDLNTAVWAVTPTGLQISWTLVPDDDSGWTAAAAFDPQPPDTFDFAISNIDIEHVRSAGLLGSGQDTDYAYVAVRVGDKPAIVVPIPDAPLNVGAGQYQGFGITNVPVGPEDVVTMAYTIVNSGHQDPSDIDKAVRSATEQVLDAAADAVQDAVEQTAVDAITDAALAAISDTAIAELVGLAASSLVGPLFGLLAGWLEGQITSILFADCDGAVASGVHVTTGALLRVAGEAGAYGVDQNPGSDSPHGCGGNSQYNISWYARPYRPDTSVTLDIGYPFNEHSTGVRTVNHRALLVFQGDGNLVVYDENNSPRWASDTDGRGASCVLQADGNLVVYDADGQTPDDAVWSSSTDNPTDCLVVQADGNVVIYDGAGNVGWASGTDH